MLGYPLILKFQGVCFSRTTIFFDGLMSQLYDGLPVPRGLTYPSAPSQAPSASIAFSETAIDRLFFGLRTCYIRDTNVLNLFPDILYLMYSFSHNPPL